LHPWFYILRDKSWLNKNYKIYIIGSLGNYRLYENQHHNLEATRKKNSRYTIVLFITERNYWQQAILVVVLQLQHAVGPFRAVPITPTYTEY